MNAKHFILFIAALLLGVSLKARAQTGDTIRDIKGFPAKDYYALVEEYYAEGNFETALSLCDTVLAYAPRSSEAYRYQADVYFRECKWKECISASEKCLALDSTSLPALRDYFYAGHTVDNYSDFANAYRQMWRNGSSFPHRAEYAAKVKEWHNNNVWSRVGTGLLATGLIWIYFFFYYKNESVSHHIVGLFRGLSLPYMLLIPAALTCIFYFLFFHFSSWIWSGNSYHPSIEYNPCSVRDSTFDHDGNEGFVMYGLALAVTCLSIAGMFILRYAGRRLRLFVLASSGVAFVFYISGIGFYPPFESVAYVLPMVLVYTALFIAGAWAVNEVIQRYPRWQVPVVALLLAPFCFLISDGFSVYDYGYSLSPALRLSYGDRIRDIYFQYDVFLSLLPLLWLKLKLGIEYIYLLSEAGYYIFFLGLYLFARRLFVDKRLPFLLLIAAFLVRYYANMGPNCIFQVTPWRLDMWLVLIVFVYWRGAHHWLLASFLGLMIVFHRNFGFIYLAAYVQLLIALLIIDIVQVRSVRAGIAVVGRHIMLSMINIAILALAFVASYLILGGVLPASALAYRKIGIGMIRISESSFYWYIPILLGSLVLVLLRDRTVLTQRYFTTGIFLVLLAAGQSIYFFGRSHEHNIINISGIFILCFFLFFDTLYQSAQRAKTDNISPRAKWKLRIYQSIPFIFIVLICLYYAISIGFKVRSLKLNRWAAEINFYQDFWGLQQMAHHSDKVFFLEFDKDFLCYYRGNYKPVGYFTPNDAWVLNKDMAAMIQGLLDSSYYVVPTDDQFADEILRLLDYNAYDQQGYTHVFYKRPATMILPGRHAVMHRTFITTLPQRGAEMPAFSLGRDFTVQCVIKPDTALQHDSTAVFSDLHAVLGYQGMQLYCIDSQRSEYVFQYGAGTYLSVSKPFVLRPGTVSYVAITTGDSTVSIYVDGILTSQARYAGDYASSDRPFILGNTRQRKREAKYRGYIYEIQIDSSRISREEIMRNLARIQLKRDSL